MCVVRGGDDEPRDIDAGPVEEECGLGGATPLCEDGRTCASNEQCASGVCDAVCQAATNVDGVKNGTETDIDCGGAAPTDAARCGVGKACLAPSDCASDGCIRDGALVGVCAESRSCATHFGGQTCGAGEVGGGGVAHESCCKTLPVPATFEDRLHPGKQVYLDKYEITAGRMREFLTRMSEAYGGEPKVKTWLLANTPPFWSSSTDETKDWTRWLPDGRSTIVSLPRFNTFRPDGDPEAVNPAGNVGSDWALGPAGWYFYTHGHNCDASYGYPTYWYPEAEWTSRHGGTAANRMSREALDVRSLNCVPAALLAAFCAWDGGQLATVRVLNAVTNVPYGSRNTPTCAAGSAHCDGGWYYGPLGRFGALTTGSKAGACTNPNNCNSFATCPGSDGCAQANYSNDAGQLFWAPRVPYFYRPTTHDDPASRIAAPGRMTTDALRIEAGDEPWMDLRGNLQELSLDDRTAGVYAFGGVHYDSIGRRAKNGPRQISPEFKIAQAGGRCMRFAP